MQQYPHIAIKDALISIFLRPDCQNKERVAQLVFNQNHQGNRKTGLKSSNNFRASAPLCPGTFSPPPSPSLPTWARFPLPVQVSRQGWFTLECRPISHIMSL